MAGASAEAQEAMCWLPLVSLLAEKPVLWFWWAEEVCVAVDTTRARFLLPHTEFTGQGRSTGTKKSIKFTYNVYHVQYIQETDI
jgi:hypothetical protein